MASRIIAGNWKMNGDLALVKAMADGLAQTLDGSSPVSVLVFPPALYLPEFGRLAGSSGVFDVGAQNMHCEKSGAFTGELSAPMLKEFGCRHVLLGHSERRRLFSESPQFVADKLFLALDYEITPILCVGETLRESQAGQLQEVLEAQLSALSGIQACNVENIIIAYEPVWAIGTGETATPEQAQDAHKRIRCLLADAFSEAAARNISIVYGGSMNAGNAEQLLQQPDIDGGLIGGASLKVEEFLTICKLAEKL